VSQTEHHRGETTQTDVERLADAVREDREPAAQEMVAKLDRRSVSLLLHRFAGAKQPAAVERLLRLGADPTVVDDGRATALHHAAAADDRRSAEALIAAGADMDVRDAQHGSSPVLWANNFGHREMVDLLLRHGARLNASDAAKLGLTAVVSGFLDDVPDSIDTAIGWPTPLVGAVSNGHESTVHLLLDRGADPNAPAGNGQTPLDATKWVDDPARRDRIIDTLRRHGASG
jgi:ankyrin repeat protein